MNLSKEAKLVSGVTLLAVPMIMYGGIVLLGILTKGVAGPVEELVLDETQWSLWRAGHAHAGVWVILSLLMQVLIDSTKLPTHLMWLARISAPLGSVVISAGFFGLAFIPEFRWVLYFGGLAMFIALVITGIGLLRNLSAPESHS